MFAASVIAAWEIQKIISPSTLKSLAASVLNGMNCELNALAMIESTSFPKELA